MAKLKKTRKERQREFEDFLRVFKYRLKTLSHWRLKKLGVLLTATQKRRFNCGRPRRCELYDRAFSDEKFRMFMAGVSNPRHRVAFLLMAALGLRTRELLNIHGSDFKDGSLVIRGVKGGFSAVLRLPDELARIIPALEADEPLIACSRQRLAHHFERYREKAGLSEVVFKTKPCGPGMVANQRHTLTLHSLRYYGIQRFYGATHDLNLTRAYARHRHLSTTELYLGTVHKEKVEALLPGLVAGLEVAQPKEPVPPSPMLEVVAAPE